jgi:hypothetical protein
LLGFWLVGVAKKLSCRFVVQDVKGTFKGRELNK